MHQERKEGVASPDVWKISWHWGRLGGHTSSLSERQTHDYHVILLNLFYEFEIDRAEPESEPESGGS